jgi:2'-5' RNA ligase
MNEDGKTSEQNKPEHYRLFIAIHIPEQIQRELVTIQENVRAKLPTGSVNWTKPEQLHVTLKFLGNVPNEQVEALKEQLGKVLKCTFSFDLRAEEVGAFPDTRFPRVIWAGLTDTHGTLAQIHQHIEVAVSRFTTKDAREKFHAHVTLGRVKHLKAPDRKLLFEVLSKMNRQFFGEWQVKEIELMRSQLSSQGAVHGRIASFPLSGLP